MIHYHEAHGHLPSRGRTRGGHRTFDEQDVRWLRNLQTPLTAAPSSFPRARAKIIFYSRGLADPAHPKQTDIRSTSR
jgi:hypothetical protein